ncbi:NUDIX domain-containing protein [Candidatus Woesearchaeota archaeon]|nr:NUDIX domain-containing protein [Candidatus Woesearchaeota archaeon]
MPQEFSAGFIVYIKEGSEIKYLLIEYKGGYWGFSRGNIEKGEKSRDTAYRELKEETGLSDVRPLEGFKEIIEFFYRKEGQVIHKDVTFYLAEAKLEDKDKITLTEHYGYVWLTFEEATAKLKFKNDKEVLKKANEFLKEYYES